MSLVAETATLVHGFTMADLDRIARAASRLRHYIRSVDENDRYECAWHAAAERLYSSVEPPRYMDLVLAGLTAIQKEVGAHLRHHGIDRNTWEPAPRFTLYWDASTVDRPGRWPEDFTDHVTERMALPQVLGLLTAMEYEAVSALAAHGSQVAAASAVGVSPHVFQQRIGRARRRIAEAWLAPDQPRQRRANACLSGHDRAEHGFMDEHGRWVCRTCKRNSHRRRRANGNKT